MTEITAKLSTALADRYKIEREIGEGGMATARQIRLLRIASRSLGLLRVPGW